MPMTVETVALEAREVSLFVRKREGTDPAATPLLLLHGWPASSRGWEAVVDAMPPERTIVCPDLRGLGQSERTGNVQQFTKEALAKDIIALIDTLRIEHFFIAGQDWGGAIAQEIAIQESDRTKALIIMNINLINNMTGNLAGFKKQMLSPLNPRWYMAFQSAPDLAEAMIPGSEDLWVRYFFDKGAGKDPSISEEVLAGYVEDYARDGTAACGANYYRAMGS